MKLTASSTVYWVPLSEDERIAYAIYDRRVGNTLEQKLRWLQVGKVWMSATANRIYFEVPAADDCETTRETLGLVIEDHIKLCRAVEKETLGE